MQLTGSSIKSDFNALHPRYPNGQFMPKGSKDQIQAIAKNTGLSVEEVAAAVNGKTSTKKCASFTNDEIKILKQIVKDRKNGYLNETTLEKAIKAIAAHESDGVMEWLIPILILIFLTTGLLQNFKPKTQVLTKLPEISTSKIKGAKPNLVYQDNLIDDSPVGSYDFTLIANGEVKGVAVPSPCDGKIAKSEELQGYGHTIAVDCEDYRWFMAHLAEKGLPVGTTVKEGEFIAIQGSTGNSTGEHIHLELSPTGTDKRISDRAITSPIVLDYIGKIR